MRRNNVGSRHAPGTGFDPGMVRRMSLPFDTTPDPASTDALIEKIRTSIIGDDRVIDGPFGRRRVTYADYTASGRSLSFIEDFIREHVLAFYANTHTETSGTGLQTTRFREDARGVIHEAVRASDEDVVIFCGSGATGAINKVVDVLNLRLPQNLNEEYKLDANIPASKRPVVFIGPYEHHSNELPWRETIADVVTIEEDLNGRISVEHLERELIKYKDRPLKIGSFSAASNVTGIGTDTRNIAVTLHKHGALSFWDFAAAGPYVQIEMNMSDDGEDGHLAYKDAIFISPHKFIGGPGTPGLLVAKRHLFQNRVPSQPGGPWGRTGGTPPSGRRTILPSMGPRRTAEPLAPPSPSRSRRSSRCDRRSAAPPPVHPETRRPTPWDQWNPGARHRIAGPTRTGRRAVGTRPCAPRRPWPG